MAIFTSEETVTREKRFILPAPWPKGSAIGELRKMMAVVENELREVRGDAAASDDVAWVTAGDNEVVVTYEIPKPSKFTFGRCRDCGDAAEYREADRASGGGLMCARHAAAVACTGRGIESCRAVPRTHQTGD